MKIEITVVYPEVKRQPPNPSEDEQHYSYDMNTGCKVWREQSDLRERLCDFLFAGCGKFPGLFDGLEGQPFDAGDPVIDEIHNQWAQFKTRSMSVGDLICIDPTGLNEWWMCANVGWSKLTGEQVRSWLDYPRQYGCCSFEINEWLKTF